jgi:hypothetical protein
LTRPTSVLVADDGAIYVTNRGISVGAGEVIRITLGPAQVDNVVVNDGAAQRSTGDGSALAAVDQLFAEDSSPGTAVFDTQWDLFLPAFRGLNVAVQRFIPPNPVRVAPVFALNYGAGSEALPALRGLQTAADRLIPGEPSRLSPIFFGLLGGTVDEPVT